MTKEDSGTREVVMFEFHGMVVRIEEVGDEVYIQLGNKIHLNKRAFIDLNKKILEYL